MKLVRTGRFGAFLDLSMGAVFFAHDKFWTRVDYEVGATLVGSDAQSGACNFIATRTATDREGILCERVEFVEIQSD